MKWSVVLELAANVLAATMIVGLVARLAWQVFRHADYTSAVYLVVGLWIVAWLLKRLGLRLHP